MCCKVNRTTVVNNKETQDNHQTLGATEHQLLLQIQCQLK